MSVSLVHPLRALDNSTSIIFSKSIYSEFGSWVGYNNIMAQWTGDADLDSRGDLEEFTVKYMIDCYCPSDCCSGYSRRSATITWDDVVYVESPNGEILDGPMSEPLC